MFLIFYISLIIICIYLLSVVSTKCFTVPAEVMSRHSNLDALRGILASLVLTHHFYITYMWKNTGLWVRPESELLNNLGTIPVSIFFMITGYLFLNKITSSQKLNFISLYKSRVKRIAPLYYFLTLIIFIITLWNIRHSSVNISQILTWLMSWLTFRGADLADFESTKILAGAQWTLIYEWGFYFLLPAIYLILNHKFFKNNLNLVLLIVFTILFFIVWKETSHKYYKLFLCGFLPIFLRKYTSPYLNKINSTYISIFLTLLICYTFFFTRGYSSQQMLLTAIIFFIIASGNNIFGMLNNIGLKFLGEISYSIYLSHGLILFLVFTQFSLLSLKDLNIYYYASLFPVIFALVYIFSIATYTYIEKPFLYKSK